MRESEVRANEQEVKLKREMDTTKKEFLAEKRQAELKAQQEIADVSRVWENKQQFAIK